MNISISRIRLFKACRRAYWLKYAQGLEPAMPAEALKVGLAYHEKLEGLYRNGSVDTTDLSKESAMATAYMQYIHPGFRVKLVEGWLNMELPSGDCLVGRVDGLAEDGRLVEHKTTSAEITEEYEYDLQWDEQILAYMLLSGSREAWYTVCRKPTIRQKSGESEEEFFRRMVEWYDQGTESKIRLMLISRTDEEVQAFRDDLDKIDQEIRRAESIGEGACYRNTGHCKHWGRRCEYAGVCLHYDPSQEYVGFVKR